MYNDDSDLFFDNEVKIKIKHSFDDIKLSNEIKNKIKEEVMIDELKEVKNKGFKEKINDFLNYEVEIPIGRIGVIAAILAIIPTTFTIYEGKKIMDNNIEYQKDITSYNNFKK